MVNLDIEKRVTLLAIYKKNSDESVREVLVQLVNAKMFSSLKEAKKTLNSLKENQFVTDNGLTVTGMLEAKKAEIEFKI